MGCSLIISASGYLACITDEIDGEGLLVKFAVDWEPLFVYKDLNSDHVALLTQRSIQAVRGKLDDFKWWHAVNDNFNRIGQPGLTRSYPVHQAVS